MHVTLPPQLEELVRRKVESGSYSSPSEVIQQALWILEARDRLREISLQELRTKIHIGLESGPASPLDVAEIKARGRKRLAQQ